MQRPDRVRLAAAAMESAFAERAGPPYKARTVNFRLPDYIDIVLNAGDDRFAFGITTGQSLPNLGPAGPGWSGREALASSCAS